LCVSATEERKDKNDKGSNERGMGGVRRGTEYEEEKTERKKRGIMVKYYEKLRRIKLSLD
jgi:hypothetical protein